MEATTNEMTVDAANAIKQRAYWATVQGFVDDLADEVKAGNIEDEDEAWEWLRQSIDGCHDVIYTYANFDVLRYSNNESAYVDDFGTEGIVSGDSINWAALAFCALEADVRETVDMDELFSDECDDEE